MVTFRLLYGDPVCRLGHAGNVVLAAWFGPPELPQLDALEKVVAQTSPGDTIGSMSLMVRGTPRFSEEARLRAAEIRKKTAMRSVGSASVVLLPGMAGVTTKMFINTINLIGGTLDSARAFDAVDPAIAWLQGRFSGKGSLTDAQLRQAASDVIGG